ncbi:hypothetical protein ANCCAN_11037 [Ancylostoma caninum]|uniref:Uncharacterized protein n=1 Tax=Ancylostoma caninum TaxID=29170 RepID=A0A368GIC9_ANCCA|nr:hypothetical protein ANCCAN_11037 [Ancylostoma caninum]
MLLCLRSVPISTCLSRHPRLYLSSRTLSDKISNAYNRSVQRQTKAGKESSGYMTREKFEEEMKSQRTQSASADHGVMPTNWQKFCLVLTRLYGSSAEIPQYVGSGTMNRMHDRMRVVFIIVAVVCFYFFFLYFESQTTNKIARDREAFAASKK